MAPNGCDLCLAVWRAVAAKDVVKPRVRFRCSLGMAKEISAKIDVIFEPKYKTVYQKAEEYIATFEKLKNFAMKSSALSNKKSTWYSLVEDMKEDLKLELYSGKR